MKLLKRLSCFIVAMSVALSCASCSPDTTWAFDYEGTRINSGMYIGFSMSAYMQASYMVSDPTQDLLTQYIEEKPAKDWILDKTRELSDRFVVVENEFEKLGLELSEDDVKAIDAQLKSTWDSSGSIYEENGVGKNSYRKILENSRKEQALFDAYYGEGGPEEVTEDDMFEYFKDEYAVMNVITFNKSKTDEEETDTDEEETDTNEEEADTNEEIDENYQKALDYAKRINDGEAFGVIVAEYTAELEELAKAEEEALQDLIAETGSAENTEVEEGNDDDETDIDDDGNTEDSNTDDELEESDDDSEVSDHDNSDEDKDDNDNNENEDESSDSENEDESSDNESEDKSSDNGSEDESSDNEIDSDIDDEQEQEETDDIEVSDEPQIQDDEETKFAFSKSSTTPSANFVETLFSFEPNGKAEVIDDGDSYYLVIRYEVEEGDSRFEDKIDSLVAEMKNEEYTEKINKLVEALEPIAINQDSIKRYDPKNIAI